METNHCPTCHSPIPENAPGGFCPACLLRDADETPAFGPAAPSLAEIAAAFPQLEVMSLIGQGGMGFVYKVRQPSLDRVVALKILSPELGRDPSFAERFAREARTLGKLHHPNIVTVFEHGEKNGFFYLLMEYVDGVNLRQAMRAGRFTPEQALAIVPGICDALQAAHAQGIWHRDIKPENILLDREGMVKIADFGIARIVGDPKRDFTLTMTGNALGSAAYMAPEQHEKPHDVDHRADIYSLGVVIYEMLTGELPLGRFPAPSQRTSVDARIDEIVFKTLEKERELRQQSATEVKTDVHRALRPAESTRSANPETTYGTSALAKLACGLLIGGALGFPLLAGIGMRADFAATFGVICVLLACVLGVITWRERLGKFVVLASGCLLVLCVLFVTWNTPSLRVRREPPQTTIIPIIKNAQVQHQDATPAPASQPPGMPIPPEPLLPVPTVSPEEVVHRMVAAANESDGTEFSKHVNLFQLLHVDSARPGGVPVVRSSKYLETLGMMELFTGEIVRIKVTGAVDQPAIPEASAIIRRRDGSLAYLIVTFDIHDGRWVATHARNPLFRASSRIEFQPQKGDAAEILKIHLGAEKYLRAVEGKPGQFDVVDFDLNAESARTRTDANILRLQESLKKFGLDSALKIISPAAGPETPYMAEDEPPYEAPKS
jgi:predicted Ser/Thr protein kinase